jgi:hypothetical protein
MDENLLKFFRVRKALLRNLKRFNKNENTINLFLDQKIVLCKKSIKKLVGINYRSKKNKNKS